MKLLSLTLVAALTASAPAQVGAIWTSSTTGTLGVTSFTGNISGVPYLGTFDLSTGDFSAARLSSSQECVAINANANWTVNFNPPVLNLRVYCVYWRGYGGQGTTGTFGPTDYTFNRTPTVLSGLANVTLTGNTMTCPDFFWHNGILEFSGQTSTLSCFSTAMEPHYHAMTFGVAGPTVGTNYCSPAVANSTGSPGTLDAAGSAVVAANDVTLVASDLPPSSFGIFLTSNTQGFTANPGGSQGNLCLGGSIGRYVGPGQIMSSSAAGVISLLLDLAQTPTPTGFVPVLPGQTRNFQMWHRDSLSGVATSNFTEAISIQFL